MTLVETQSDAELRFGRPSIGAGPITTYRLTPEQLEEFNRRFPPAPVQGAKPIHIPNMSLQHGNSARRATIHPLARAEPISPEFAHEESEKIVAAKRQPLRRDEYLALRLQGHTPEQIEKDFRFTHRILQAMRGKWRLLREEDETAALAALGASAGQTSDSAEQSVPAAPVAASDSSLERAASGTDGPDENFGAWASRVIHENLHAESHPPTPNTEESCVVIRIPLWAIHQWIEGTGQNIIPATKLHRNESLSLSIDLVLEALGRSWMELEDLLGDTDILVHLQGYIDRKLAVHLEKQPTISNRDLEG